MNDSLRVQLSLASGSGLLARAERALLFFPSVESDHQTDSARELIEGFRRTPEFGMLAEIVLRHDLDVHPFVWISWDEDLVLRSFGSAVLETDIASVPLLSGAASGTWVEHRVMPWPDQATIRSGENPLTLSQLDSGVVPCGGFSLLLHRMSSPAHRQTTAAPNPSGPTITTSGSIDDPMRIASESSQNAESAEDTESPQNAKGAEPIESIERQEPEDQELPSIDARAIAALLDADETIIPEVEPEISFASLLVNDEPRWSLVLDDGGREAIEQGISIGRSPEPSLSRRAIMIEGDRVSRHHFDLIPQADSCEIIDTGSRNGTVVIPAEGGGPIALIPGEPVPLRSGSAIYFGSRSATIEWGNRLDAVNLVLGLEP